MFRTGGKIAASMFVVLAGAISACGTPGGDAAGEATKVPEFDTSSAGPRSTTDACVSSTAAANLKNVNLVFMYDRSGSMGDTNNTPPFDPNLKWIPVSTGMKAFFGDERSHTMSASLQFFPLGTDVESNCTAAYATPKVALASLGDATAFTGAIDSTKPQGGTPTLPALQGAISYAKTVVAKHPDEKSVIVLVTDGEPGFMINGKFQAGCPNNDVAHVAAAAQAAYKGSPSIATYVIGVGPALDNLNTIAAAGGTGAASMVSVDNPTKTAETFQEALDKIRGQVLSCDFAMPKPPEGKALDIEAVNVAITGSSGEEILSYSGDCKDGKGWKYDNLAAPTKVELCPSACDLATGASRGKLTVAFGCKTKGDVK